MHKTISTSSLSSFEGQIYQHNLTRTVFRAANKNKDHRKPNNDDFSQFEDSKAEILCLQNYKNITKQSQEAIKNLKNEIATLKQQNVKLSSNNNKLKQQIEILRKKNAQIESLPQQSKNRESKPNKKQKIEELMKETFRIKEVMHEFRQQSQKYKTKIHALEDEIEAYEKMKVQWKWKDSFIDLFIDMLQKISTDMDRNWTNKKKIQIGWKITKKMIYQALSAGLKIPRVERYKQ